MIIYELAHEIPPEHPYIIGYIIKIKLVIWYAYQDWISETFAVTFQEDELSFFLHVGLKK